MQDDSLEGRVVMTNQMREMIYQNEQSLKQKRNTYGYRDEGNHNLTSSDGVEKISKGGTFSLRLFFSLVILVAFVYVHTQNSGIFGHQTDEVVETISHSTNLQELTDSVKINP